MQLTRCMGVCVSLCQGTVWGQVWLWRVGVSPERLQESLAQSFFSPSSLNVFFQVSSGLQSPVEPPLASMRPWS